MTLKATSSSHLVEFSCLKQFLMAFLNMKIDVSKYSACFVYKLCVLVYNFLNAQLWRHSAFARHWGDEFDSRSKQCYIWKRWNRPNASVSEVKHKTCKFGLTCSAVALHGEVMRQFLGPNRVKTLKVGPTAAISCRRDGKIFAQKLFFLVL